MNTPVLLIAWRRPQTLRQVINAIRPVSPTRMFVACDGPNFDRPGESAKVSATRQVIENEINWSCDINYLYSDENQGCRLGVSRAIGWFFAHVDEGIILEDDCVPHPDFFPYCESLLQRYRHDTRVWCISGNNFQDGHVRGDGSYYFSRIPLIWGWATWRRCWQHYDVGITKWPVLKDSALIEEIFSDPLERTYWSNTWQWLFDRGLPDTWDYQWLLTCLSNGGLSIEPNQNLVNNVGFGEDATHTTGEQRPTTVAAGLGELVHPTFVLCNPEAARYTFDHVFTGAQLRRDLEPLQRLKSKIQLKFSRLFV